MALNNKDYWLKREEEKLNAGIKDCNKLSKELQIQYKKALRRILLKAKFRTRIRTWVSGVASVLTTILF